MDIAVVGTGYVGLVSGACFAELGAHVTCVDLDPQKIAGLQNGVIPIYEPGLETLVQRNQESGRLRFTTRLEEVLDQVELVFISVGTPSLPNGAADLSAVFEVARLIGQNLTNYVAVVNKSTVPVGTAEQVRQIISHELQKRDLKVEFDVASNPEFLKEGNAIEDFMKPDRVVVGVDSQRVRQLFTTLYRPILLNNFRVFFMDIPSAEMTKYASNAMLATRISFINDIANLCELVGADISMVRRGVGSDSRIGNKFLYPGAGYGGSCFPKDVQALIHVAREHGYELKVIEAVKEVNDLQKQRLFSKFQNHYHGAIAGKRVTVWGLSFKPGTDDIRESPALTLIAQLLDAQCIVTVYDPIAMKQAEKQLGAQVTYADNLYDSVQDAEALFHVTEWKEFRMPRWKQIRKAMKNPLLIDGRNVFDPQELARQGFTYLRIG